VNCNTSLYETDEVDKQSPVCNSCANRIGLIPSSAEPRNKSQPGADFLGVLKSESIQMQTDVVTLHQIWRETTRKLESFARDVRESKRVLEASDFARWLQFSGVVKIMEAFPNPEPLRVDGAAIRKQISDLLYDCGESFRNGKADPKYAASDIAEINRKLEVIAAHVATLSPPSKISTADTGNSPPVLTVLEGGGNVRVHTEEEEAQAREARPAPFPLLSIKHLYDS